MRKVAIGVDIGGTNTAIGVVDPEEDDNIAKEIAEWDEKEQIEEAFKVEQSLPSIPQKTKKEAIKE